MSVLLNAFTAALAILALAIWIAAREWGRVRGRIRQVMQGMLAVSVLLCVVVVFQTAYPRAPLAHATLHRGQRMEYVSTGGRVALLAHAKLPEVHSDRSVSLDYRLGVRVDGDVVQRQQVTFEEHWGHRRIGRNGGRVPVLQARDEQRVHLAKVPKGHTLSITVDDVHSKEPSPLDLSIIRAPFDTLWIGILGGLLAVAATVLDVRVPRRTHQGMVTTFFTLFCLLLTAGVTPDSGIGRVVTTGFVGMAFGALAGLILRVIVGWVAGVTPPEPVKRKVRATS